MELNFIRDLFLILAAALAGGIVVRLFKLTPLLGYILAGILFGVLIPLKGIGVENLAEVGAILLLFSIGIELSLNRLAKVLKIALLGATLQIILVTLLSFLLLRILGVNVNAALILSLGFSLSSTAVVVKALVERGETGTLSGEVMIGWLLVQDLAVIPIMVILPALAGGGGGIFLTAGKALFNAGLVVAAIVFVGKFLSPFVIHKIAALNSRELLLLASVALALGTALVTSFFGISPALGAFLAGVVISESQENHAVFAETRPLRDLFVALFFVTMGFLVSPQAIIANLGLIVLITALVLIVKFLVVFFLSLALGYHGKVAVTAGIGLAQIGEFSFIIFSAARGLNLINSEITSVGVTVTLMTLLATPFLFKGIVPFWHFLRDHLSKVSFLNKLILGWDRGNMEKEMGLENHIIICGYGRVGGWVGRALESVKIPFVVIDFDQKVVNDLKKMGREVIYGDPTEPEVLEAAGIKKAKVVVLALPDRIAQETLITHIQTIVPTVKIISRVHLNEDWEKLRTLRVDKIVQPEFEAAIAIVKTIFVSMGKSKEEVAERVRKLRLSKAMT